MRSYDSGASGTVIVKVTQGSTSRELKARVPYDQNGNGIADKWEKDNNIYVANRDEAQAKAASDDETITELLDQEYTDDWPGDGWGTADEYRGIFKESTDIAVTRLNPARKEVMVCPEDTDEVYDMWSYDTGKYNAPEHDYVKIHQDFVKRAFDNPAGLFGHEWTVWKRDDIGWVNFNSTGKRAYAIRIERAGTHADGDHVSGESPDGSPGPHSKSRIFYEGITNHLKTSFDQANVVPSAKQLQDSIDTVVVTTISHEIGHSLDCDHCLDKSCLMYRHGDNKNKKDAAPYKWNG